jgi:hypothetical protein
MAARDPDRFAAAPEHEEFDRHVTSMWRAMYQSALAWVGDDGLFVTEAAVRSGRALPGLGRLAGASLAVGSIDASLHHHDGPAEHTVSERHATGGAAREQLADTVVRVEQRLRRDAERLDAALRRR